VETGLDYFKARYFAAAQGRFTTPDPLMASASAANPQSWNRYAYVLNNPLRLIDPDGTDPGCGSGDDSKCKVVIRVNVIYDANANSGKGLTDKQKQDFQDKTLGKAIQDYGKSGIGIQVTYTAGSMTVDDGRATITGVQSNSLNVLVTDKLPTGNAGESAPANNGLYLSMVGVGDAHNANAFPLFTNTVEHEMMHQLKGDTEHPNTNPAAYIANEFNVDFRDQMMGLGVRQDSAASGAQNKPFTVQPGEKNVKPKADK